MALQLSEPGGKSDLNQSSAQVAALARRDQFLALVGKRPLVMGIVNATPDSFSDGGRFESAPAAVAQACKLVADGADIVDVGAESTRPGHTPVPADVEQARLEPVLRKLVEAIDRPVSVDTSKAAVARWAASQGAAFINDVWGLQKDPAMADAVAEAELGVVIMHNRPEADPACDIVAEMRRFFDHSLELAGKAGIPRSRIILDPGVGFGKTQGQNLAALRHLPDLLDYGLPLLVGVSRKSLLGSILQSGIDHRLIGTLAANLVAAAHGASIFRVHDAAEHVAAFKVFEAIENA